MLTQQTKLKFPNVFIQSHSKEHLRAIYREAERAGYTASFANKLPRMEEVIKGKHERGEFGERGCDVVVHLEGTGVIWVYTIYTRHAIEQWPTNPNNKHSVYEGAKFLNLRKLRGEVEKLRSSKSQDNQSQLVVRPKHLSLISDLDNYLYNYGEPDAQIKTCVGCATTKECTYRKAYGGTCIKSNSIPELAQVLEPTTTQGKVVYTVKPSLVGRITRRLVLTGSKVLNVLSSVIKFLRGSK